MLEATDGYKKAIVGDVREIITQAVLEIVDPDIQYGAVTDSGHAPFSKGEQLHDRTLSTSSRYATLEPGRWLLDGSFRGIPVPPEKLDGQVGFAGNVISDAGGFFPAGTFVEMKFSGVSILQALSVSFSSDPVDGVAEDFKVTVMSAGSAAYTKEITGNSKAVVSVTGFTVFAPDAIRVEVSRWSIPGRRLRVSEIIPGTYEEMTDDTVVSVDLQLRANFSCLSIPYGVCNLTIDNKDRRFEPRNRQGIFKSIEERQGIPISIGCRLADGSVEYKKAGVFYQASGGWETSNNDMTMTWNLVDIIGLISQREYVVPEVLPTTLGGWVESIVSQLGVNFKNRWHVDPAYKGHVLKVNNADDVKGRLCGDVLRFACMATGTFPRADQNTGFLAVEPLWNAGNKVTLDNMASYPTMTANEELAILTFKIYDAAGKGETYNISGNSTSSSQTISVDNPFVHTIDDALRAARQILSQYGGIKIETVGRGDPASEIGDVDTIWLDESEEATGRRIEQEFRISEGFLSECRSVFLQADGSLLYENVKVFEKDTEWTPPDGVSECRVILAQGGQGGEHGEDGRVVIEGGISPGPGVGRTGSDGLGGKVWAGLVNINPGLPIKIHIGQGSAPVEDRQERIDGGETTFGSYATSANGQRYPIGFTNISSGKTYGRTGVEKPKNGTGDGAKGGIGGADGARVFDHWEDILDADGNVIGHRAIYKKVSNPTKAEKSTRGADGVCVVSWEKR